jgi:hypothetical protein
MAPLPEDLSSGSLVWYRQPLGVASGGPGVCQAGARGGVRFGRMMVKSYLSIATVDKKDRRIRCLGLVCF